MSDLQVISLFAGKRPDGEDVVEQIRVKATDNNSFIVVQSPAFIQGLASGDEIAFDNKDNSFELLKHSGNLAIRIFARTKIDEMKDNLVGALEKLGGELDFSNERMMIFSIHVSCGFKEIEAILNRHIGEKTHSAWFYGNVYDPADGTTPLNWWLELDKEQ
ncbi:DUF4265 domain-containing protein [Agaribacterium haliotis]|uniref:DUF4265 domain-containing protein n=1 Tax=Agaribacterium haliotis TaxID=2013869 RepID=UPI000BB54E96|nr:DUF4265 domain-containing protein [Agaribacterium haliotis]